MKDFPEFMKNPKNRIKKSSQYTKDIEGFAFNGKDGSQIVFWTCNENRKSNEHVHEYDEYLACVASKYNVIVNGKIETLKPGDELFIPAGVLNSGECTAGTRTIHAFGGKRAEIESE